MTPVCHRLSRSVLASAIFAVLCAARLGANPIGGQVQSGTATVAQAGSTVTVDQTSNRAIISWQDFSIAPGETTRFNLPDANAAVLNRVRGGNLSEIYGTLSSNGQVFLLNPNGVLIGQSGVINTAGFVASSLDVADHDFLTGGDLTFRADPAAPAGVVQNFGSVFAGSGDLLLVAPLVRNTGTLAAPHGTVGLAAGAEVLVKPTGSERVFIRAAGADGGRVDNSGLVTAATAELKAAAGNPYALAINHTGTIRATGTAVRDGRLWLVAGTGDASGAKPQLAGALQSTGTLAVANANGAGGFIETSGSALAVTGSVTTGAGGRWLLDPTNVTIDAGQADTIRASLTAGTHVTVEADNTITVSANITAAGTGNLDLVSDVDRSRAGTVTFGPGIKITNTGGGSVGIYYNPTTNYTTPTDYSGNVALSGGGSLRAGMWLHDVNDLQAMATNLAGSYALSGNINASATSGWNAGAGFAPVGSLATPFSGNFYGRGYTIDGLTINRPTTDQVGLFGWILGNGHDVSIKSLAFTNAAVTGRRYTGVLAGGIGDTVDSQSFGFGVPWHRLEDVSAAGALTANGDAAGGLVGWANQTDFVRASTNVALNSNGSMVGGLVGEVVLGRVDSSSSIGNVTVTSAGDVSFIGGLMGKNGGPVIGYSSSVTRSYARGNVTVNANSANYVGGLSGNLQDGLPGDLSLLYATGHVTVNAAMAYRIGGLVGLSGYLTYSYATGNVTVNGPGYDIGGLVGFSSIVGHSFATGTVHVSDTLYGGIGALLGPNSVSSAFNSFWNVDTAGVDGTIGQGLTTAQFQDTAGFMALSGWDFTSIWAPPSAGHYPELYAVNPVVLATVPATQTYGDSTPTISTNIKGGPGSYVFGPAGDTLNVANTLTTSITAATPVGSYASSVSAAGSATSTQGVNYRIVTLGGTTAVTARPITVTGNNHSRAYGDANPTLTASVTSGSLVNGDTLSGAGATTATTTSNVGSYATTQGTLAASANYALTFNAGTLAVTARPLTLTGGNVTKVYGDANPALTYSLTTGNLVNGDTLSGSVATAVGATTGVGNHAITQGSVTAGANYGITFNAGALAVTARPLTLTGTNATRLYGDANPVFAYSLTSGNLVNGDTLSGAAATTAGVGTGVGSYAITQGAVTAGANYGITFAPATLAITARPLTVSVNPGQTKVYGDADPVFAYTGNFVNGDTATGALARATGENVGNAYAIAQGTLNAGANYAVTFNGSTFAITPRAITVTADNQTRSYGSANPTLTPSVTTGSLAFSDTLSGSLTTTGGTTSNVGNYAITQGTLAASSNYNLTFASGTLAVTPRPLSVTAANQSKVYGDATPSLTAAITSGSLVNGDTLSGAVTTAVTATTGVGSYAISQGTVAAGANYALTFNAGTLAVTPRPLTLTGGNATKVYGDANPALTYSLTSGNLVNGDALSGSVATAVDATTGVGNHTITQGSVTAGANYGITFNPGAFAVTARPITLTGTNATRLYGEANPAFAYSLTSGNLVNGDTLSGAAATVAGVGTGVGNHAITQGSVTAGANYNLTFAPATLAITPRPLTVTVNPGQTKVYGDADPGFTYAANFVNGDTASGALARVAGENVGNAYAIAPGTLNAGANYSVTFNGSTFAITPRSITLAASPATKGYGAADPSLGATISAGSLGSQAVNDTLADVTGTLTRAAGESIGTYDVALGSGARASNYTITFNGDNDAFNITKAILTVIANDLSKTYGDTLSFAGSEFTVTGLRETDSVSRVDLASPGADSAAGVAATPYTVAVTNASGAGLANYDIVYQAGGLTVTPRPITVTGGNATRLYGEANPAFAYSLTSGNLVNGDTLSGAPATSAGVGTGVGNHAITQGALTAGANYNLTFAPATLAITPRPLTVTVNPGQTKVYGDADPGFTYAANFVNGDTATGALGRAAGENAGNAYAITQGTINAGANYTVTFNRSTFAITPRPITLTATPATKGYGTANPTLGATISVGSLGSTAVNDTLADVTGTLTRTPGESVGTYDVALGSGGRASNYTITFSGANDAFTITKALLTVIANDLSKTYGDTRSFAGSEFTVTGLRGTDSVGRVDLASPGAAATAGVGATPYTVAVTNASGVGLANYDIAYQAGRLTVTPRPITVTANDRTKSTLDLLDLGTTAFSASGLASGDTLQAVSLTSGGSAANAAVGNYAIVPSDARGDTFNASNYQIAYVPGNLRVDVDQNSVAMIAGFQASLNAPSTVGAIGSTTSFTSGPASGPDATGPSPDSNDQDNRPDDRSTEDSTPTVAIAYGAAAGTNRSPSPAIFHLNSSDVR